MRYLEGGAIEFQTEGGGTVSVIDLLPNLFRVYIAYPPHYSETALFIAQYEIANRGDTATFLATSHYGHQLEIALSREVFETYFQRYNDVQPMEWEPINYRLPRYSGQIRQL